MDELDTVVSFGDAVKAVKQDDGSIKLGGYLIRFGDPTQHDLTGDYFTKNTDFGNAKKSDGWFNHRMPVRYQKKKMSYKEQLPDATLGVDDVGVFAEIILGARNEYERTIAEMGLAGKLGWSSGTAPHLVDRKEVGNGIYEITRWKLGLDASLTPIPAEPRNGVMPLKSLLTPEPVDSLKEPEEEANPNVLKTMENNIMEKEDIKAIVSDTVKQTLEGMSEQMETKAAQVAEQKLTEFKATLPEVKAGYHLEVVKDEADNAAENPNAWKTSGEFFRAVKNAAFGIVDKRLKANYVDEEGNVKATGLNEAIPSQGGFLVPETTAAGIVERMYQTGSIMNMLNIDPVQGNSMTYNAVDETSRVNGSRKGGIQAYWAAEAGTMTSSRPTFNQIDLKLKKVYGLVYATDEQLEDVPFMTSWINREVPNELRFKVEDAVVEGTGGGLPLGYMNSDALVSVTRVDANLVQYNDIVNMWSRRFAGVNDYVWLIHQDVNPQLDRLILNGTGSIPPRFVDYDAQGIMRIKGKPVYEVEYCATLGTAGDIALVSWSQYAAIQKASGIQSASSIHVAFTTGEQAFRFTYRFDGAPLWESALTPFKGTNTVSPFVVLSATS